MKMDKKKTLILSIVGVLVLVIAVVGVSFAMYSFSATGTKENVISTGSVSVVFNGPNVLNLENEYPMTDAKGMARTDNHYDFSVAATINGTMTIGYELGVKETTNNPNAANIKINCTKDNGPLVGTPTTGVKYGTLGPANTIGGGFKVLETGQTFTTTETHNYKLKAWIDEAYELPNEGLKAHCEGATGATSEECGTAGGKWVQSKETTSETFKLQVKVSATQK